MFNLKHSLRRTLFYLLLIPIFFTTAVKSFAFSDDFTSDPRTNPDWEVQNSEGMVFDNPGITLSSTNSSFPYLKTSSSNNLSSNKYHEIKFQYLNSDSNWGVGASFTDNPPDFPTYFGPVDDYLEYNIAYFFGNHLHSVSTLCPKGSPLCPNNWWFIYPNNPPTNTYMSSTPRDFNVHTFSTIRTDHADSLSSYEVYMDGNLIVETQPTNRIINSIWIGHPSNLDSPKIWPVLRILSVKSLPLPPATFPYLSQKDPLWGSKEYDSAGTWAGAEKSGIERWGCALTSAAMMLQNYDVQTATGSATTPDGLNDWLKNEPDGYIGLGHVNWLAITRYVRESYETEHASTKLEFTRTYPPSTPELPAILGVPGHFVVAHGEDATNWNINDPASETKQTLDKTSTITSINKFVPSLTDLSYMLLAIDSDTVATLTNESGATVPGSWIDEYLSDDTELATGSAIRTLMIPKPSSGKYKLTVNRPADATERLVKIYLYDKLGNTDPLLLPLPLPTTYFEIQYGSEVGDIRSAVEVDRTPPSAPVLVSPAEGEHVNTNGLVLDWDEVEDPSTPITYNYQSNWPGGGHYGPVSTGTNSFINAPGTPDNVYNWQVQACDSADNCSEWASRELVVDSTAPTVDLVFPTPGPSSNYFEAVFSELVDPVAATSGANYYLSNWPGAGGSGDLAGDANITYNPESKTARILFTNPGWYISAEQLWGVQNISDLAGNRLKVNPYSEYSTAMIAPVLASPPTTTPNPVATLTQTWSWLAGSDSGSGIASYYSRIYDNLLGSYTTDWLSLGNVLSVSTSLGEGKWKLSLQVGDRAGNKSEVMDSSELVVDVTPPSVATNLHFDNPTVACGGFTNIKTVTIDWDDATDNTKVAGYEYNVDYPLPSGVRGSWTTFFTSSQYRGSLNEGIHYIKLRTKDTVGNYSSWSNSCAITYDSKIPTFDTMTTYEGWYREPQTSYFDYTDPNMLSDYLAPSCEINSEGLAETCQVTPNVCDKAGNCNTTLRISNTAMIDLTKPVVGIDVWGQTLSGTASDTLSQIDKVQIRLTKPGESETTVTATGTTSWSYVIDHAPVGHYKAIIVAYDIAGNTSEESVKEYDINLSSAQSTTSSTPTPTPSPSPSGLVAGASTQQLGVEDETDEVEVSTIPRPSMSPSPKAEVLGEATQVERGFNYWWLLGIIPVVVLLAIFRAKKKWSSAS